MTTALLPAASTSPAIRVCPACRHDNSRGPASRWSHGSWIVRECPTCQFVYLENAPEYAELEEHFAWEKTHAAERLERRRREPVLHAVGGLIKRLRSLVGRFRRPKVHRLIERCSPGRRILDVGCGGGGLFERIAERFTPFGVEISKQLAGAANQAARRRGGYVVQGAALVALARFAGAFFDLVVMLSYLEHEREPAEVLRRAWRLLKPGGMLIVKVPNFASFNRRVRGRRWCGFRFPDHVNYFTPATLTTMLEAAGFQIVRFGLADRLPTSDNMWLVARRPAAHSRRVAKAA